MALKIVKSAHHYTETALDEIELLKKVLLQLFSGHQWNLLFCPLIVRRPYLWGLLMYKDLMDLGLLKVYMYLCP